jgi:cobalamin biosynthesis protein CobD/CbiB
MGDGRREADVKDIVRALALYRAADALLVAVVAALAATAIAPG